MILLDLQSLECELENHDDHHHPSHASLLLCG
jgi:hypothetical protein